MKIVSSESLGLSRAYFTEADSFSQVNYNISCNELLTKLKLALLLNDHVVLAASHVFESENTYNILEEYPILLQSDAIIVDLRSDCENFSDFSELEKRKKNIPTYYWRKKQNLQKIATFLNNNSNHVISWNPKNTSAAFQLTVLRDLLNKKSPLRKKLRSVDKDSLCKVTCEIGNADSLSREKISVLCDKYIQDKKNAFQKYVDVLYYLNGAPHVGDPVMHPKAVNLCENKFSSISSIKSDIDEHKAFDRLLNGIEVPTSVLECLSIERLLEIRDDESWKRFRKKWSNIIETTKKSTEREDAMESCPLLMDELKYLIEGGNAGGTQLDREIKVLIVSSIVTSFVTTIVTNPTLEPASLLLDLVCIDPGLANIERKWGSKEIVLFCSQLSKKKLSQIK